jgi:hypothetical protein
MSFSAEAISLYSINTWISPTAPERIFLFKNGHLHQCIIITIILPAEHDVVVVRHNRTSL